MRVANLTACFLMALLVGSCGSDEWVPLFDGKTLNGWEASENKDSWKIIDGAIVTDGPRSHLFYAGEVMNHDFKNFELLADVMTETSANSGIYIHTEYQEEGWPAKGYECQVFCSKPEVEPGGYIEHKMTGSIYAIRNTWKSPVADNEWFRYRITVRGKTISCYINDELITEYTEPDDPYRPEGFPGRLLSSGTFALQCHDPASKVWYKNIKVKPLPDEIESPGLIQEDPDFEKLILDLGASNFPLIDLHVHLKRGLTMDAALENARKYGFTYGIAVNCGLKMGLETDAEVEAYLNEYTQPPHTWHAMQAEGREWMDMFSQDVISRFDYVFTDAMTWTNDEGKRMRLWIEEETEVGDQENFMEQLVNRIETILTSEPVDIYVNPTYLPDEINPMYDELWTEERMDRVIKALVENQVALEINNRRMIPSPAFIKRAKEAGVKFTFGTNNGGADDLGRMDYAIKMIQECSLNSTDIWMPAD